MNRGKFVFAQLLATLPDRDFRRIVIKYGGDRKVTAFPCYSHFLCMVYAQVTGQTSLREIEESLRSRGRQLYHLGFRGSISKSTLADANENRDPHIYQDVATILVAKARQLVRGLQELEIDAAVYAIDSTVVTLCLALFPWAKYKRGMGGIKIHTEYEVNESIPTMVHVTRAKDADILWLNDIILHQGSYYIIDRGYVGYKQLHRIHAAKAYFVTRTKNNLAFTTISDLPVDAETGILYDRLVLAKTDAASGIFPDKLRLVGYKNAEDGKVYEYMTNILHQPPLVVASLYKARWQVETFFRWIKQNLRIKHFYGNSKNAVLIQVWVMIATYAMLTILKRERMINASLHTIMTVISSNIFEKEPIEQLVANIYDVFGSDDFGNQLALNF